MNLSFNAASIYEYTQGDIEADVLHISFRPLAVLSTLCSRPAIFPATSSAVP